MRVRVRTLAQHPALRPAMLRFHRRGWPPFLADEAASGLWPALYRDFADFQVGLLDRAGRVVAIGNAIPFRWDGRPARVPGRMVDLLRRGIAGRRAGHVPTALSAVAAIVHPAHQGQGLSAQVIAALAGRARAHGLRRLVAPVRPSLKGRCPLTPMARYVRWADPGDGPFDPWLRVHWRLGAKILRVIPRGNTVRASVAQWEARTGLAFPESGRYLVPGAFQPIRVDRARDRVRYDGANVWMVHHVPPRRRRR